MNDSTERPLQRTPDSLTNWRELEADRMALSRPNQLSPVERTLRYLLRDLCVDWGYCLPPAETERIAKSTTITAAQFAEAVLRAEGGDAASPSEELVERIAQRFIAYVGSAELPPGHSNDEP
jgi:hypothetical protein